MRNRPEHGTPVRPLLHVQARLRRAGRRKSAPPSSGGLLGPALLDQRQDARQRRQMRPREILGLELDSESFLEEDGQLHDAERIKNVAVEKVEIWIDRS